MARVSLDIKGKRRVKRALRRYGKDVIQKAAGAAEATARKIQDEARRNVTVITSNLQGSIQVADIEVANGVIRARVGPGVDEITPKVRSALEYAKAQEFGFTGVVDVRAHRRTITEAFGEPIQPRTIDVESHTRKMDIPGQFYMTRAAKAHRNTFKELVIEAIQTIT